MVQASYTLQEAAARLGITRRVLQRRIQDGEFPSRFMAPGPHGPELRIPADALPADAPGAESRAMIPAPTAIPTAPSAVGPAPDWGLTEAPQASPTTTQLSSLTHSDLESLRDAVIAIVREEREVFLDSMQSVLAGRDAPLEEVQREVQQANARLDRLQSNLQRMEGELGRWWRSQAEGSETWAELIGAERDPSGLDVDELLQELSGLESMLGLSDTP